MKISYCYPRMVYSITSGCLLLLLLTACASYPLDEAVRQRAAAAEASERERMALLEQRKNNAVYGDIVIVTLEGGAFNWKDRSYPLRPVAFELVRGETRRIELIGQSGSRTFRGAWQVTFTEDGLMVTLNASAFSTPLILVNKGKWDDGDAIILASLGVDQVERLSLNGMVATVRYKPLPGMPERIIIEKR